MRKSNRGYIIRSPDERPVRRRADTRRGDPKPPRRRLAGGVTFAWRSPMNRTLARALSAALAAAPIALGLLAGLLHASLARPRWPRQSRRLCRGLLLGSRGGVRAPEGREVRHRRATPEARVASPSYEQVSSGETGHAESVRVVYDPTVISYEQLLEVFFTGGARSDPAQPPGAGRWDAVPLDRVLHRRRPEEERRGLRGQADARPRRSRRRSSPRSRRSAPSIGRRTITSTTWRATRTSRTSSSTTRRRWRTCGRRSRCSTASRQND